MKALFNCRHIAIDLSPAWTGSPYLQPICNRPLLEYWLDLCVWLGIQEVLLVAYPGEERVLEALPQGADWGLRIQTAQGNPDDVLPDTLNQHALSLNEDLLILDGPVFPFYNRKQLKPMLSAEPEPVIYTLDQSKMRLDFTALLFPLATLKHLLQGRSESERFQRWTSLPLDRHPQLSFQVMLAQSVRDYYILNLQVLEAHSQFNLKGFEVAPGVFEGIHNEIAQRPALGGPLLTGKYCKLGAGVQLERVILHDQIRLEGQAQLRNCLVWGPVYLGDLTLENCLVLQNQCLDPFSGQISDLVQPYRLKQVLENHEQAQARQYADIQVVSKLLLTRWPLYQLLRWAVPQVLQKYYLNANGEVLIIPYYAYPAAPNALQRLFFSWSLHRVPLLQAVRQGQLALVGTRLLPARSEYLKYMQQLPVYAPGAFSHSEELEPQSLTHWFEELHYCSQHSPEMDEAIWRSSLALAKQRPVHQLEPDPPEPRLQA